MSDTSAQYREILPDGRSTDEMTDREILIAVLREIRHLRDAVQETVDELYSILNDVPSSLAILPYTIGQIVAGSVDKINHSKTVIHLRGTAGNYDLVLGGTGEQSRTMADFLRLYGVSLEDLARDNPSHAEFVEMLVGREPVR